MLNDLTEEDKRDTNYLCTLYKVEPEIRDIYVEGESDKRIIKWFLENSGITNVDVYEIDTINVTNEILEIHGLERNNRGEVIALASELDASLDADNNISCIIDGDFDYLIGNTSQLNNLLLTDYTSMDLYFYEDYIFDKLLKIGLKKEQNNLTALKNNLSEILQDLFAIRATNNQLKYNLSYRDFKKHLSVQEDKINFDRKSYIDSYLTSNGRHSDISKFTKTCNNFRKMTVKSKRQKIHGHDFITLLSWYLCKIIGTGGNKYSSQEVITAIVRTGVEINRLEKESLFSNIKNRYK